MSDVLLDIRDLKTHFQMREGIVRAVDGVSLQVKRGQILGVVGESGCGKSVTAKCIVRIESPARIIQGEVLYYPALKENTKASTVREVPLHALKPTGREIRSIRWKAISMIFQEPMTSFGPMHTIGNQIQEALTLHMNMKKDEAWEKATQSLDDVGMPRPTEVMNQFPHQLSGGMRQRAMIAMALCCQPDLLIADEPTTALDVTTEAQILELIKERQQALGMSVLFITHSLAVISQMADEIIVMYLGKIVEYADITSLFYDPKHPYTRALMGAIPRVDRDPEGRLAVLEGSVPDPYLRPPGCPFHPRCPECIEGICNMVEPPLITLGPNRTVSCHLYAGTEQTENVK